MREREREYKQENGFKDKRVSRWYRNAKWSFWKDNIVDNWSAEWRRNILKLDFQTVSGQNRREREREWERENERTMLRLCKITPRVNDTITHLFNKLLLPIRFSGVWKECASGMLAFDFMRRFLINLPKKRKGFCFQEKSFANKVINVTEMTKSKQKWSQFRCMLKVWFDEPRLRKQTSKKTPSLFHRCSSSVGWWKNNGYRCFPHALNEQTGGTKLYTSREWMKRMMRRAEKKWAMKESNHRPAFSETSIEI